MRLAEIAAVAAALMVAACGGADSSRGDDTAIVDDEPGFVSAPEAAEDDALIADAAGDDAWRVDREASTIMFSGTEGGDAFTGRFNRFDAAIALDPAAPGDGTIAAVIDLGSVDAGTNERNQSLPEPNWFDVAQFPTARFVSTDIRRTPGGYEAVGTLSIKGVERPATLPFTLAVDGDRAVANGTLAVDRTDFGIGQGDFAGPESVGIDVEVAVHIEADRG